MAVEAPTGFRFLYRTDQGRIDRAQWIAGSAPLSMLFLLGTVLLAGGLPYANRPLAERAFYDPLTFAANSYILLYAAGLILLGVSDVWQFIVKGGVIAAAAKNA